MILPKPCTRMSTISFLGLSLTLFFVSSVSQSYTVFEERIKLLITKAEAGDKRAQYKLGVAYLGGASVSYNHKRGMYWIRKSAKQQYYKAWFKLGHIYYKKKHYRTSFRWYLKAAKAGHGASQFYVAQMYFKGRGVAPNHSKALIWAARAKYSGVTDANSLTRKIDATIVRNLKRSKQRSRQKARRKARMRARKLARLRQLRKKAQEKAELKARQEKRLFAAIKAEAKSDAIIRVIAEARWLANARSRVIKLKEPSTNSDFREVLYTGKWLQGSVPSDYVPSVTSVCEKVRDKITCTSRRIREKYPDHTVHFRIISKITNMRGKGEFTISYQKYYLLALRDDPDSETAIPEKGLGHKTFKLKCRIQNRNTIHCVKPDKSMLMLTSNQAKEDKS